MRETLYEKLVSYQESDYYGFHMPGHKRNLEVAKASLPYGIDITEIDGFDDLHHAGGILREAQERAARVYGASESFYLVNGSTAGILSAVMGCTRKGDRILMARNCHKSAYHALFLNELHVEYVYPRYVEEYDLNGEIAVKDVERILDADLPGKAGMGEKPCVEKEPQEGEKPHVGEEPRVANRTDAEKDGGSLRQEREGRIRAVVIVSPTYEGVVSDVRAIAEVAHAHGIPLIVDEAHGAHFGFHEYFPENANALGADVVIHSLHKTLPSLTQTALLHVNGEIVDREEIKRYLQIFQSSSPSYVLMAGIDECVHLLETRRVELFETYVMMLEKARAALQNMRCLRLVEPSGLRFDRSKIVVSTRGTGKSRKWLYRKLLEDYHLQMEMATGNYVIAMTSVGDTREGMERFVKAMLEIDGELWQNSNVREREERNPCLADGGGAGFALPRVEQVYTCAKALDMSHNQRNGRGDFGLPWETRAVRDSGHSRETREGCVSGLPWEECEGRVSAEYAYVYPPGIPLLVPGERVSREVLDILERYRSSGFEIRGLRQEGMIAVLEDI